VKGLHLSATERFMAGEIPRLRLGSCAGPLAPGLGGPELGGTYRRLGRPCHRRVTWRGEVRHRAARHCDRRSALGAVRQWCGGGDTGAGGVRRARFARTPSCAGGSAHGRGRDTRRLHYRILVAQRLSLGSDENPTVSISPEQRAHRATPPLQRSADPQRPNAPSPVAHHPGRAESAEHPRHGWAITEHQARLCFRQ
jgi:hypothetical protein